ncbi:MAG: hypothetical protein ACP5XB_22280 [Isosphaeraceae bacterium]
MIARAETRKHRWIGLLAIVIALAGPVSAVTAGEFKLKDRTL